MRKTAQQIFERYSFKQVLGGRTLTASEYWGQWVEMGSHLRRLLVWFSW